MRDTVKDLGAGALVIVVVVVGASRSERVPVRRRARVEVRATMETWVAGELELGIEGVEGG